MLTAAYPLLQAHPTHAMQAKPCAFPPYVVCEVCEILKPHRPQQLRIAGSDVTLLQLDKIPARNVNAIGL